MEMPKYAILGSGRVARHLQFYFAGLGLPAHYWSRNGDPLFNSKNRFNSKDQLNSKPLATLVEESSHILFAVRDQAIAELSRPWVGGGKTLVHFSGTLVLPGVHAAHPLMTFGGQLESLDWYKKIPFVLDAGESLSEILPGLPNPSWNLAASERPLYHALCSLAANASYLLWEKIGDEFEQSLSLPRHLLSPLLHQIVQNAAHPSQANFTGPVARGDWQTVQKHLQALEIKPQLLNAYQQYLAMARPDTLEVTP